MREGSKPWGGWPFGAADAGPGVASSGGSAPRTVLKAPEAKRIEQSLVELAWEEAPSSDNVGGYELEICHINALHGQMPWFKAHRGRQSTKVLRSLGREVAGVRARVRPYNFHGKGEWSKPSSIFLLKDLEQQPRCEIDEIPASWLAVDLAGLPELDERNNAAFLLLTQEELLRALYAHRTVIKVLFRYYALAGVTTVDDDPSTMTMVQFGNFCRGVRVIDGKAVSSSDVDRIFLRAVRVLPQAQPAAGGMGPGGSTLTAALAKSGIKVSKEWKKAKAAVSVTSLLSKGSNLMSQPQFVAALVRLASARYADAQEISLGDKLARLCEAHLSDHAFKEMRLVDNDFSARMHSRAMGAAICGSNATQLRQVFEAYSRADTSNAEAKRNLVTMNVREAHQLCEAAGLFDKAFGIRELLAAFVRVNIDDDLFVQDEAVDTSSELVYEEFEEFIARVFAGAVWVPLQQAGQTASLLDQDGDGDLDEDDLDELFYECDEDESGSISLRELSTALAKRLNAAAAELVAERIVAIADENGSGLLTREELGTAVRKMREERPSADGERPGDFERAFKTWLLNSFLPPALKAATSKKLLASG